MRAQTPGMKTKSGWATQNFESPTLFPENCFFCWLLHAESASPAMSLVCTCCLDWLHCRYGAEQGKGDLRAAICEKLYSRAGRKPTEIFVSDGSKCDIGRLQVRSQSLSSAGEVSCPDLKSSSSMGEHCHHELAQYICVL